VSAATTLPPELPLREALGWYRDAFRGLPRLRAEDFDGVYDGLVLGPGWFQLAFRAMLDAGGLRGWRGKEFHGGRGINLVERGGEIRKIAPMRVTGTFPSRLDEQPTLCLGYERGPLATIRDEIRRYDDRTVLGMTYVDRGPLPMLAMPFALRLRAA
jgi:hypothetical protein